jgi:hypothetical protein
MPGRLPPWSAHHRTPHTMLTPPTKTPRLGRASTRVNCALAPPQRLTSELTVGKSIAAGETREHPLVGHPRMNSVHKDHAERRRVDPVHRRPICIPWTSASWSTVSHAMPTAEGHSLVEAHGYDVAASQLATCPTRPGPDQPNLKPTEARLRPSPC